VRREKWDERRETGNGRWNKWVVLLRIKLRSIFDESEYNSEQGCSGYANSSFC